MPYSIRVSTSPSFGESSAQPFFSKEYANQEEFETVTGLLYNRKRIDLWTALIFPVRTDTFQNFIRDFFFPSLINHALKCNDLALKILFSMVMPIWDLCTLPLRMISAVPRYCYNAKHTKESHPFYQYLIANGAPSEKLAEGHVYLERTWEEGRRGLNNLLESDRNSVKLGTTFNFMELPKTASSTQTQYSRMGLPLLPQPQIEEIG